MLETQDPARTQLQNLPNAADCVNGTILILVPFYLPAYKAGGCVRGVSNVVAALADRFRFKIICRDRDLGDADPFPDIASGRWNSVGPAEVYYLPPGLRGLRDLYRLLRHSSFDALYLNSFFSSVFTAFPLFLRRIRLVRRSPVLLAVRGELHDGALSIRTRQKTIYRSLARVLGLYRGVMYQVVGPLERKDLSSWFLKQSSRAKIFECADLVEVRSCRPQRGKEAGELRIVFLSRLIRNKNLAYALELLQNIGGRIEFDIYGPKEDSAYWAECESLIRSAPQNVTIRYCGVVKQEDVPATFSRYHLFLFPSAGESFGYVIQEAICAACPVMTSDLTPWRLEEDRGGWSIPLSNPEAFRSRIEKLVRMDREEYSLLEAMTENLCDDLQRGRSEDMPKMARIFGVLLQPEAASTTPRIQVC